MPNGATQQGSRMVTLRTGQTQFAMQTAMPNNVGDQSQQQFIVSNAPNQQQNMHILQQRNQVGQQRMMLQVSRMSQQQIQQQAQHQHQLQQQTQQFTINTQTNVKLSIQSQQQIAVDNVSFVSNASPVQSHQLFTNTNQPQQISIQSQPQQQQQPNLNDLLNFDQQQSPSVSQQQFNLDLVNVNATGTGNSKNITSDYVKQKLNSFVNERSGNVQQQQNQLIIQQQVQQQQPSQQQIIQQQQPNTPQSNSTNALDNWIIDTFDDSFDFDNGNSINLSSVVGLGPSTNSPNNNGLNRANSVVSHSNVLNRN